MKKSHIIRNRTISLKHNICEWHRRIFGWTCPLIWQSGNLAISVCVKQTSVWSNACDVCAWQEHCGIRSIANIAAYLMLPTGVRHVIQKAESRIVKDFLSHYMACMLICYTHWNIWLTCFGQFCFIWFFLLHRWIL